MNEQEYIKNRLDNQIDWYNRKSLVNKKLHLWSKGLIIVFAAMIPFASGFISSTTECLNLVIAFLGALTAIFTALAALLKFQENWVEYRTTSETLKHEKYLYLTNSGPYEGKDEPFKIFVSRIESLISRENTSWSQYFNKTNQ